METICVFLTNILPGTSVGDVLQESRLAQHACVPDLANVPLTVINSCSSAASKDSLTAAKPQALRVCGFSLGTSETHVGYLCPHFTDVFHQDTRSLVQTG
eukprot:3840652-Heterocapsa_arctica.AAC.1